MIVGISIKRSHTGQPESLRVPGPVMVISRLTRDNRDERPARCTRLWSAFGLSAGRPVTVTDASVMVVPRACRGGLPVGGSPSQAVRVGRSPSVPKFRRARELLTEDSISADIFPNELARVCRSRAEDAKMALSRCSFSILINYGELH
jgi:hypothetical protein